MPNDSDKRLFLLDAFALIYRAYYSFIRNPRINSKGFNTSAAYGFTTAMLDLIRREKPTHIAVVFDTAGPTERHVDHTEYKANREAMPEDIRNNLSYIRRIIEAFKIPILESDGYEADDVIGTLAKKAEDKGYITYMVTPDKDFGQLVTENIFMYRPGRGGGGPEIWGPKEVCEKFEIERPEQVIDILGLWGDAVDNIPGIPGIGEKTSKKLIAQYGSVEGLIENAEDLKGKQKENVINFADQGLLSKKLATIILDVPVDLDPTSLELEDPDNDKIVEIFSELEFRTLAKRLLGDDVALKQAQGGQMDLFGHSNGEGSSSDASESQLELVELKNIENTKHKYHLVQEEKDLKALIGVLAQSKSFCFDTETTGIDERTAELVGLSFSVKAGEAYYVPADADQKKANELVARFKEVFESERIQKVAQNIKYDLTILKRYGVEIQGPMFDTMLAHYLIQADMRHNMDVLAETYLGYSPVSITELIGKKGKDQLSMRDVPAEKVSEYAGEDADITLQLKEIFEPKIKEDYQELFNDIEMPLTKVLSAMEGEGIKIDIPALENMSKELGDDIDKLGKKILELAGTDFNIDSPKQLGQVLFEVLEITDKPKKTRTGQYSTSEDVLSSLAEAHEIVPNILEYRMLRKLKNTYVDTLPGMADQKTHRIHTDYMQAVAATGRLSSNDPNLQNIPIRTEKGRAIRKAFIPKDDDHVLLAADYSQIELRLVAALSKDDNMIEAFKQGMDIHAATAAKVFGVEVGDVDRDMRGKAKAVNFGIIYGQSAFGLSQNLKIPRSEAREIIDSYFREFPRVKAYMDENIEFCKEHGYVETIKGRRRYLKDINSANGTVRSAAERVAINAPMQGSAADIIKIAMINIHKELQGKKTKMLLQVHDELVFDLHKSEMDEVQSMVKELMEGAVKLDVPLVVDINVGKNWLEAH